MGVAVLRHLDPSNVTHQRTAKHHLGCLVFAAAAEAEYVRAGFSEGAPELPTRTGSVNADRALFLRCTQSSFAGPW